MGPVNPLKSFSLANAATPAILSGSLVDDPPARHGQDLKATEAFSSFLREALRIRCASLHGKRRHGTSIDELCRNAKYIRALLSGYSINSTGSKYKDSLERMRMNFSVDFPAASELFRLEGITLGPDIFMRVNPETFEFAKMKKKNKKNKKKKRKEKEKMFRFPCSHDKKETINRR